MYIYVRMSSHPVLNTDHTDTLHQKGKIPADLSKISIEMCTWNMDINPSNVHKSIVQCLTM